MANNERSHVVLHSLWPAVPAPAIEWILHNDCNSNAYFATLANVCKGWREVCRKALIVEVISHTRIDLCSSSLESLEVLIGREPEVNRYWKNGSISNKFSTLHNLLLADMACELILRQGEKIKHADRSVSSTDGNFCLAWFAPSGIQITSVSIDSEEKHHNSDGFKLVSRKKSSKQCSNDSVSCCREWRGYRHATEVLTPFGYATSFVTVSNGMQ